MRALPTFSLVAFAILAGDATKAHAAPPGGEADVAPERLRSAADEFDMGRRAFLGADYEQAAIHFENAFRDAPRAEALRNAIRARRAAKEPARAATLASLAGVRYGADPVTMALVNETLAALSPQLLGVTVACEPTCTVAADGRIVSIVDATSIGVYLPPGHHELVISWGDDRARRIAVDGAAGSAQEVHVVAPPAAPAAPAAPASPPPTLANEPPAAPSSSKPFGVAVPIALGVVTAGLAAATVVSGLDAQQHPGADAVRRDCVGLGEACPTYQEGQRAQTRTNVLLASAIGAGAVTALVAIFLTHGRTEPRADLAKSAAVSIAPVQGGGWVGAAGTF